MKSPQDMAAKLAQQWHHADWRERQLLGGSAAWPLVLPIGQPSTHIFLGDATALRSHLQQWRGVEHQGLGTVKWQDKRSRGSSDTVGAFAEWASGDADDGFGGGLDAEARRQVADFHAALRRVSGRCRERWQGEQGECVEPAHDESFPRYRSELSRLRWRIRDRAGAGSG